LEKKQFGLLMIFVSPASISSYNMLQNSRDTLGTNWSITPQYNCLIGFHLATHDH
jgi:hypothetical protein